MTIMSPEERVQYGERVLRVLEFFANHDIRESLKWCWEIEPATIRPYLDASDWFRKGAVEAVYFGADDLPAIEQAMRECEAMAKFCEGYGPLLWACRKEKRRPAKESYPDCEKLWPLFDACGPEKNE